MTEKFDLRCKRKKKPAAEIERFLYSIKFKVSINTKEHTIFKSGRQRFLAFQEYFSIVQSTQNEIECKRKRSTYIFLFIEKN